MAKIHSVSSAEQSSLIVPPDLNKNVSVCICTYKRPALLKRLLSELERQETAGLFSYSVVVADNDEAQSAWATISEFVARSTVPVTYCVEPRQSIALARNKAVENASGDFIAFIDDDEFPTVDWLLNLFASCAKYRVDGVLGPVKRHFDEQPPRWILKSSFYERPTYPTGYVLHWREGRSGNLFVKGELLKGEAAPFNPQFRTGEDQDFLRRMMEANHTFIWCNEAVVFEVVPPIRWNRKFMLKRALLRGAMEPRVATFGFCDVAKSLIAVPTYAVALPFAFLLGQHRFMTLLVKLCDHLGKLLALVGIDPVTEEYVTN
jgi:succinoglycan biosynthesis protein ExoM